MTLTDKELIEKCSEWISRLCKSGGNAWSLSVPVNETKDPDTLFTELIKRFEEREITLPEKFDSIHSDAMRGWNECVDEFYWLNPHLNVTPKPMENKNQSAFPYLGYDSHTGKPNEINEGLTKREYFAACAMQGIIMGRFDLNSESIAKHSIDIADELLNQLNREQETEQKG